MKLKHFFYFGILLSSGLACRPLAPEASTSVPAIGIIGGTSAEAQDFPYIVNIWQNSPSDSFVDHLCGASLIHRKWVLTAAHCVLEDVLDPKRGTVKLKDLKLFLGSLHRSGQGGRELTAKTIQVHPQFAWPKYDIALIELNEIIEDVSPVELNSKAITDFSNQPTATAAGWGLTDEQGKVDAPMLLKVDLSLVSREVCQADAYIQDKSWGIGPETICAETHQGLKATCAGDSGGPLVQKINGKPVQIGVVSWGSACRPSYRGKQSNIEGYSDVSAAYPWIRKQISF